MRLSKKRVRRAGILEVAARAGVSPATVSRYFNHPDIVRFDTRTRIQAAAVDLGYVRNRAAGSLNRGRSGTVGLVVPTVDNAIFAELIQEFASALNATDHALLISAHGYDLNHEADQVQTLLEHQIDGLVLVGSAHAEETFQLIAANDLPALTVWNWQPDARLPCIGIDNRQLGRMSAKYLFDLGHREIACLFPGDQGNDRADDRRRGALAFLAGAGTPVPRNRQIPCPYDIDKAKIIAARALADPHPPTAILAGNDIIGQAALFAAASRGLSAPDNISVMGIGDFRGSGALEPGLTTIRIPAKNIAAKAAETIVDMVENTADTANLSQQLHPELLVRSSTAAPTDGKGRDIGKGPDMSFPD